MSREYFEPYARTATSWGAAPAMSSIMVERPASFDASMAAGAAALNDNHEREAGLLRSFLEAQALRNAIVSDDELAGLQSVEEIALRGRDLRGHGDQIGLGGEAVGILLLRPEV